jgi:hypothetical protein
MNKRDIELALQAGLGKPYVSKTRCTSGVKINDVDALQRFADLIRADEREACAKVCEQPIDEIQITDTISEVVYMDAHECASRIRARGNT